MKIKLFQEYTVKVQSRNLYFCRIGAKCEEICMYWKRMSPLRNQKVSNSPQIYFSDEVLRPYENETLASTETTKYEGARREFVTKLLPGTKQQPRM